MVRHFMRPPPKPETFRRHVKRARRKPRAPWSDRVPYVAHPRESPGEVAARFLMEVRSYRRQVKLILLPNIRIP